MTIRADSLEPAQALWLERQTEYLYPEVLRRRRKPLNALKLFTPNTEVPEHARSYTRRMLTSHGRAKIVNERGDDLPFVGIGAAAETYKVETLGVAYGYTRTDIIRSAALNMNLPVEIGVEAERAMGELQNDIFWYGDTAFRLYGAVTNPFFPRVPLARITMATAADDIVAWVVSILTACRTLHGGPDWCPDKCAFANSIYTVISSRRIGDTPTTVLEYIKKMQQEKGEPVEFMVARELDAAGPNGEDLVFAWNSDPEVVSPTIPGNVAFRQLPVQEVPGTLRFVVPCYGKTGGTSTWRPLEAVIGVMALS